MDPESRLRLTEKFVQQISCFKPPEHFDYLTPTDAELVKYGLPACLDKNAPSDLRAVWEQVASHSSSVVAP